MAADRLTPLDASFLEVETASAHMHVGWAAAFSRPSAGAAPTFEQLRDHIARRLPRAPRYRQRLAGVPLGVNRPVWVDDEHFDIEHHVRRADAGSLMELAATVMSTPLARERPLWELWIADRLEEGKIGLMGKAHHCMVDGVAAVELAALLLDPAPDSPSEPPESWSPARAPAPLQRLLAGAVDRLREELELVTLPARLMASPRRLVEGTSRARRAVRAMADSLVPATPRRGLNDPLSPYRHLATFSCSMDDLRRIKRAFGTTLNDVVLTAAAGALGELLQRRGERPGRLKTMVPVNVRDAGAAEQPGNRISFLFLELPCEEPDPIRRLREINLATSERKRAGLPEGTDAVLNLVSFAPSTVQRAISRLVASPRTFNVVVSNIPGPPDPLYMLGCQLREAYPIVPLADRHTLSIGFTTAAGGAFFGVYADRDLMPDAETVSQGIREQVDVLLSKARRRRSRAAAPRPEGAGTPSSG